MYLIYVHELIKLSRRQIYVSTFFVADRRRDQSIETPFDINQLNADIRTPTSMRSYCFLCAILCRSLQRRADPDFCPPSVKPQFQSKSALYHKAVFVIFHISHERTTLLFSAGTPAPLTEPQSAWNGRMGRCTRSVDLGV